MKAIVGAALLSLTLYACAAGPERITVTAKPPPVGTYKVGDPYYVSGVRYVPREQPDYRETGIASWYGPKFHGRRTANGEVFDMYQPSAAHKTLPMPSLVRVTNLENGKSMIVRVNDRGPFVHGRIIDLSYRAAQMLGFANRGTARVRVEYHDDAVGAAAKPAIEAADLPPLDGETTASAQAPALAGPTLAETQIETIPVAPSELYVQAGAFGEAGNATRLSRQLAYIGPTFVASVLVRGRNFYRVRLGPYETIEAADAALERVIGAGHTEARIVVEEWQH